MNSKLLKNTLELLAELNYQTQPLSSKLDELKQDLQTALTQPKPKPVGFIYDLNRGLGNSVPIPDIGFYHPLPPIGTKFYKGSDIFEDEATNGNVS
jgi:hypothetical protein